MACGGGVVIACVPVLVAAGWSVTVAAALVVAAHAAWRRWLR